MNSIILIAGPSASGKSTIAREVARLRGVPCFSLDDYFIKGAKAFVDTPSGRIRTFERPGLYNGAALAEELSRAKDGAVVEGFCLFTYPAMCAIEGKRYYLDVPFSTCAERRRIRRPRRLSDQTYLVIGEGENAAFVLPQRSLARMSVLDGTRSTALLVQGIMAD